MFKVRDSKGLEQKWAKRTRWRPAQERARDPRSRPLPKMKWFSLIKGNKNISLFSWSTERSKTDREKVWNSFVEGPKRKQQETRWWRERVFSTPHPWLILFSRLLPFFLLLFPSLPTFLSLKNCIRCYRTFSVLMIVWRCRHISSISATVRPRCHVQIKLAVLSKLNITKNKIREMNPNQSKWLQAE